jgi:hypothetical protein
MKKPSRPNSAPRQPRKKVASKKPDAARAAAAPALATGTTTARLLRIISSYGIVPNPTASTIVGPAVPSMGQFTLDVNREFGRTYVLGQLKSTWTVNQTANFIDNNP